MSVDELLGNNEVKIEPQIVTETKYVYEKPVKPVLGVCEGCNKPLYEASQIVRWSSGIRNMANHISCKNCKKKEEERQVQRRIDKSISNRKKSFIIGGIVSGIWLAISAYSAISTSDAKAFLGSAAIAIVLFTFISCCILKNNFVGDMVLTIFSWGFVKMPGLITTLDLDGLI